MLQHHDVESNKELSEAKEIRDRIKKLKDELYNFCHKSLKKKITISYKYDTNFEEENLITIL